VRTGLIVIAGLVGTPVLLALVLFVVVSSVGFRGCDTPLESHTEYVVDLYVVPVPPASSAPRRGTTPRSRPTAAPTDDAYLLLMGGTATFRPADLVADRVWFDGRLVTPEQFARDACRVEG
jgi:hypothetical protein